MRITISGLPGSGTSTITRLLAKKLGVKYVNGGQILRDMAKKAKVDLIKFTEMAELDPAIDQEIDQQMIGHARQNTQIILEGRLIGYFCHQENIAAYKVWLAAPIDIRVRRICQREKLPFARAKFLTSKRENIERKRYQKHYHIDTRNLSIYDLLVDTSTKTPPQIMGIILSKIKEEYGSHSRV